jgi:hypothetical protein
MLSPFRAVIAPPELNRFSKLDTAIAFTKFRRIDGQLVWTFTLPSRRIEVLGCDLEAS